MTRYEYVERYLQPKINDELYHHGILGMKWGVRRYQNEDGSLTPAGEKRYGTVGTKLSKEQKKDIKAKNKELRNLRADVVDAYGWNKAAKGLQAKERKTHEGNLDTLSKLKQKYGDALSDEEYSKWKKSSEDRYNVSKAVAEAYQNNYDTKINEYKSKAMEYAKMYGEKRITDIKHLKTTKNGEEYVTGWDDSERIISLESNPDGTMSINMVQNRYI